MADKGIGKEKENIRKRKCVSEFAGIVDTKGQTFLC